MRSPGSTSEAGGVSWASLSLRQSGGADRGEKGGLHFSLLTVWIALHAVGGRGKESADRTVFAETDWGASAKEASLKNLGLGTGLS